MENVLAEDRIKKAQGRLEGIKARISSIPPEIKAAQQRITDGEVKLGHLREDIETLRRGRQKLLAEGQGAEDKSRALKEMRDDFELVEDERIGLEEKVSCLQDEEKLLREKEAETEKEIIKINLLPLVGQYNKLAEKMAGVLKNLFVNTWKLGEDARRNSVFVSSHFASFTREDGALAMIPRLYLIEEVSGGREMISFLETRVFQAEWVASRSGEAP